MKEDFKQQFRKLYFIAIFCTIWLGIPYYFVNTYNDPNLYAFTLLTWIPAIFITLYLSEK